MITSTCRPRWWPEKLGACPRCLSDATDAGQPLTWNRHWMNPLATVCRIHGTWLTPVATRMLARVHHVEDFGGVVQYVETAQALLDCELPCAGDALWLQDLCNARMNLRLPWRSTRPNDSTRIVDGVARTLIAESNSDDSACRATANRRALTVKGFAFEPTAGQRAVTSLPTWLRQRQWVLARVAHVLRWAPEARTFHSSWSSASVEHLASMRRWPERVLAWVCLKSAGLGRRQGELRKELSISPAYFRACSGSLPRRSH